MLGSQACVHTPVLWGAGHGSQGCVHTRQAFGEPSDKHSPWMSFENTYISMCVHACMRVYERVIDKQFSHPREPLRAPSRCTRSHYTQDETAHVPMGTLFSYPWGVVPLGPKELWPILWLSHAWPVCLLTTVGAGCFSLHLLTALAASPQAAALQ